VLRDGAGVAGLGVGLGIATSAALARIISSVEYGVTDPVTKRYSFVRCAENPLLVAPRQSTPPPVKPEALVQVIEVVPAIVENVATTVEQGALSVSVPSSVIPLRVPVTVPLMTFVASAAAFHVPVTALPL
jgi:hypothetical protein